MPIEFLALISCQMFHVFSFFLQNVCIFRGMSVLGVFFLLFVALRVHYNP